MDPVRLFAQPSLPFGAACEAAPSGAACGPAPFAGASESGPFAVASEPGPLAAARAPESLALFEPAPGSEGRAPAPLAATCAPASPRAAVRLRDPPRPESLHPALWLGHQLARHGETALASGFDALDAELPGGGWPRRALTELLLPHPGVGEIRLLAPSLVATQRAGRLVMLFDPPAGLSGAALARLGFDVEALLVIQTRARVIPGTDSLWALEQALKSGHVGAVLAWLPPRLRAERLRRLQLAAHAHDGPAFVLCEASAAQRPTAAPLRLALRPAGADVLALRLLKRRGPLREAPLRLVLPPVLSLPARQRANAGLGWGAPASAESGRLAAQGIALAAAPARGLRAATFVDLAPG
jgi:protein ImuA